MTVKELREELSWMDDDKPVVFQYPSGDHWGTLICSGIKEIGEGKVKYSSYHSKNVRAEDDEEVGDEDKTVQFAVIIE